MLTIKIPNGAELFDEENNKFTESNEGIVIELEHSLVSLSKWESIWEKPFLDEKEKTTEEILSYVACMVVTPDFAVEHLKKLSDSNLIAINNYIDAKRTATWFSEPKRPPRSPETITSELVYYWMFAAGIPIECETWFLNRLFTLIKVFGLKNAKPEKMKPGEEAARRRELNAQRKAEYKTRG